MNTLASWSAERSSALDRVVGCWPLAMVRADSGRRRCSEQQWVGTRSTASLDNRDGVGAVPTDMIRVRALPACGGKQADGPFHYAGHSPYERCSGTGILPVRADRLEALSHYQRAAPVPGRKVRTHSGKSFAARTCGRWVWAANRVAAQTAEIVQGTRNEMATNGA
jgi:hypothetical protein